MLPILVGDQYFWGFFILHYGALSEKATKDIKSYLHHILYTALYYRVQYTVCTHYSKYTAACAIHSRPYIQLYRVQYTLYNMRVYTVHLCTLYAVIDVRISRGYRVCTILHIAVRPYPQITTVDLHVRSKFRSRSTKFSRSLEIRNTKFSTRVQY